MVGPGAPAVTLRYAAACLQFDADHTTVVALEDEVDLFAVTGSPTTDIDRVAYRRNTHARRTHLELPNPRLRATEVAKFGICQALIL